MAISNVPKVVNGQRVFDDNGNYLGDPSKTAADFAKSLGWSDQTTTPAPAQPATTQPDYNNQINSSYDLMQKSKLAQLQALRDAQNAQINQQKQETTQGFRSARSQTDVTNLQNIQRLREVMAANGLSSSGENVTANIAANAQRQRSITDLLGQEQNAMNKLNLQSNDINNPARQQAALDEINAQRAQALLQAMYKQSDDTFRNSQFDYQKQHDQTQDNFTRGQMTGYLDASPDIMAKAQELARIKDANRYGGNQGLVDQANSLRGYLTSQGIDANRLFGGDVTPEQALANVAQLRTPTLQKQQVDYQKTVDERNFNEQQRQFNVTTQQRADQFSTDMGYKYAALNQQERLAMAAASARAAKSSGGGSGGGMSGTGDKTLDRALAKDLMTDSNTMYQALNAGKLTVDQARTAIKGARLSYGDAYADGLDNVLNSYVSDQVSNVRTGDSNELAKRGHSGGGNQITYQSTVTPEAADLASRYLGQ